MHPILALALTLGGTTITLQDTTEPGAIAEVEMNNLPVNSDHDDSAYALTLRDMQVWLTFRCSSGPAGADSIHVEPPDGMICKPASCALEIMEGFDGKLYLYPWEGM